MLVLKRLRDALADGDEIAAVVRGSAINHDGKSSGLTVPSGPAQRKVIQQALAAAHLEPDQVSYVEAHGTGTPLGDPIEMQTLAAVFGRRGEGVAPLVVGAVKTNLGHTEAASGMASVIKVALMLKHREIPPHLHFEKLSPQIELGGAAIEIPTSLAPWSAKEGRGRIAGVSSFGLSGTNAHVILEEAPAPPPAEETPPLREEHLLLLSARKSDALSTLALRYGQWLREACERDGEAPSLADVCRTAAVGRTHHEHRLAVICSSLEEARERLEAHLRGDETAEIATGQRPTHGPPKIAFVFSGQGPQRPGMGLELFQREAVFRQAMEACDEALSEVAGYSVLEELRAEGDASRLGETRFAQGALFALQMSLAALWRSWGLEPEAVVGHSLGEVAAACVAGALTLEDGARVIHHRSRLLQEITGQGRMAAVGLSAEAAQEALQGYEGRLAVAAVNGPSSAVLSGEPEALDEVLAKLKKKKVFCRPLEVDYAFHSPQTEAMGPQLAEALDELTPKVAAIPFASAVDGEIGDGTALGAGYWSRNLTQPVLFAQAVESLRDAQASLFLEIGPHPVLAASLRQGVDGLVLPSLAREASETRTVLSTLAALYAAGAEVDWSALYPHGRPVTTLPTYPWQRRRFWPEAASTKGGAGSPRREGPRHPLLGHPLESPANRPGDLYWELDLAAGNGSLPGLQEVRGKTVVPCSTFTRLALTAAREALSWEQPAVTGLGIETPLVVSGDSRRVLQLGLVETGARQRRFVAHSRPPGEGGAWILHVSGTLEER
jgi:myxalamid-type polyketide synthase MxaE and MxaD